MQAPESTVNPVLLDRMRYRADPLADTTVSRILGPWHEVAATSSSDDALRTNAAQWQRLGAVNRLFGKWQDNRSLIGWRVEDRDTPPEIAALLEDYVRTAQVLPAWADPAKITRAEELFIDFGVLSCLLLFCSSLPECYVIPDLSTVLHASGQLETRTDHRIRATAAMIFPVMMQGGLTDPKGSGLAQILKVRLIHATIRNLILRGNPEAALQAFEADGQNPAARRVLPLASLQASTDMQQTLYAHGWDLGDMGLPCNQEEQAYTLLTFSYVFLRSLRRLGLGLSRADEEAYLHTWNVVGHVLGLQRELMADTMAQAAELFAAMQARGRARQVEPDSRPALTRALMQTMAQVLPLRVLKPFPVLLTHYLCGRTTAKALGLRQQVPWLSRLLFAAGMLVIRAIDSTVRLVVPGFSLSRLFTRLLGDRLMAQILLDQTRPLKLPSTLLNQVQAMVVNWRAKPKAAR